MRLASAVIAGGLRVDSALDSLMISMREVTSIEDKFKFCFRSFLCVFVYHKYYFLMTAQNARGCSPTIHPPD